MKGPGLWRKGVRLWHTLRWLKPVQIWGRIRYRLWQPRPRRLASEGLRAVPSAPWRGGLRAPSLRGPARFELFSEVRDIATAADWSAADASRLWLYNLHYFDDLVAGDAAARRDWHEALIERWVRDNPPPRRPGWDAYPTSLRLVNWVKFALSGGRLSGAARDSLATQADWLSRRVEHHLQANHLIANAKGLIFAGAAQEGSRAAGWLRQGATLMQAELAAQILADGGHEERAPMYHALVLEDLLDIVQLDRCLPGCLPGELVALCHDRAGPMLGWLAAMTHPDGEVAQFNDAALGVAPPFDRLSEYAAACDIAAPGAPGALCLLPESGYARLSAGPAELICDAGPLGPDHQPGHGHADTLSFELSLDGRRLIVDAGTSTYEVGELRAYERSTAAHNTVEVGGASSSDVWASFRVGHRARVSGLRAEAGAEGLMLEAAHDGYAQTGGPVHRRRWLLRADGLTVFDRLEGGVAPATGRLRFAPGVTLAETQDGVSVQHGETRLTIRVSDATPRIEEGHWAPGFGRREPCAVLALAFEAPEVTTELDWSGGGR